MVGDVWMVSLIQGDRVACLEIENPISPFFRAFEGFLGKLELWQSEGYSSYGNPLWGDGFAANDCFYYEDTSVSFQETKANLSNTRQSRGVASSISQDLHRQWSLIMRSQPRVDMRLGTLVCWHLSHPWGGRTCLCRTSWSLIGKSM